MKNYQPIPNWEELEANWLKNYDAANYDNSMSAKVLSSTHKLIENDRDLKSNYNTVLELGVGTMVHFNSVKHDFSSYIASDHDPKVIEFLEAHSWDSRVRIKRLMGDDLPFESNSIDRVIATHVLEHILEPEKALEEWVRVLKPGGVLSLILPCDPGFLWRIGRNFGPRTVGVKAGLPYDYYMAVEHRNSIHSLIQIIKFHFRNRKDFYWPVRIKTPDFNLIYAVNIYV